MFRRILNVWDHTSFYLGKKVFYTGYTVAALFVLSFFAEALEAVALFLLFAVGILVAADTWLLYRKGGLSGRRELPSRFSLSDENKVVLFFRNDYSFRVFVTVIDELPYQLQERHWSRKLRIEGHSEVELPYMVVPAERGEFNFGRMNVYAGGPLQLVQRRYRLGEPAMVKVYPSFVQLRRYELLGVASRLREAGVKRLRRLGHSLEFEQIKEYVRGDDYRTINWKATARNGDLMVNTYTDERSQQVYCLVNKGRVMKMPFEGMTMLDYAVNASLVLSNTALQKGDRAGLITFEKGVDAFLPAEKKPGQLNNILETLYNEQTAFLEPDMEKLFSAVRNRITQRSLLVLFTNFESADSLERDLPALKGLAHYHLLVVVFFENTELRTLTDTKAKTTEDIYIKTIAEKYRHEKQLIVKELQMNGIVTVLSPPQSLTVNTLNKYLELKARQRT